MHVIGRWGQCVCVFGAGLEAQAAEAGEQPESGHGQVGLVWQQPSLHTATTNGETAADTGIKRREGDGDSDLERGSFTRKTAVKGADVQLPI